jgi:DNA-binding IclR family transcriptional regulator
MATNIFTGTLLKAMNILYCFSNDQQELGIKELSQNVCLPESSVYRIVQTFEYLGIFIQNSSNKKYRIGPQYYAMNMNFNAYNSAMDIAKKHMRQLRDEVGENVNLGIRSESTVIMIFKEECNEILRPNYPVGKKFPAYCTSLGKMLLSDLSPHILKNIYSTNDGNIQDAYPDVTVFLKEIANIKKNGYAIDDEELSKGLRCVSAPIMITGDMLFSISISGPKVRISDQKFEILRDSVISKAARISDEIISSGLFL